MGVCSMYVCYDRESQAKKINFFSGVQCTWRTEGLLNEVKSTTKHTIPALSSSTILSWEFIHLLQTFSCARYFSSQLCKIPNILHKNSLSKSNLKDNNWAQDQCKNHAQNWVIYNKKNLSKNRKWLKSRQRNFERQTGWGLILKTALIFFAYWC